MTYFIAPNPYTLARRWARIAGYEPSRDLSLPVDVREEEDAYILNALVPGLKPADLNIQVLEDVVTISGEFKADESEYLMRELPHGSFTRTLRLPVSLDAGKAEAKITDGVLTLRLAKAEISPSQDHQGSGQVKIIPGTHFPLSFRAPERRSETLISGKILSSFPGEILCERNLPFSDHPDPAGCLRRPRHPDCHPGACHRHSQPDRQPDRPHAAGHPGHAGRHGSERQG